MKSEAKKTVLFVSGLSLRQSSSFSRQLDLLAGGLQRRGWRVVTADPGLSAAALDKLANRYRPRAAILLGYPDQFPLLERQWRFPIYLWAQCSSPPEHPYLDRVISVALTEISRIYLVNAGGRCLDLAIPHAVDTEVFRPTAPPRAGFPPDRRFVVGSVGANSLRKRFDLLFRAFRLFCSRIPASLLIIKTDRAAKPGGYDLHRLAEAEGLAAKVRIIDGELSASDMASLYRNMDMYVQTAEWEGFGIPVLEAMSCGVPVVTPPIQGPGEIVPYTDWLVWDSLVVRDGKTVLRWANPAAVAAALEHAWKHPELRSAAGRMGRYAAVARYDTRIVASLWEKVLI
jgi:glycosyltransferase involved in cell wall biosynthesis